MMMSRAATVDNDRLGAWKMVPALRASMDEMATWLAQGNTAALVQACDDDESHPVMRAVAGHILALHDVSVAHDRLLERVLDAKGGDPTSRVIALGGLRYIVPLREWLNRLNECCPTVGGDAAVSRSLAKLWMRATGIGGYAIDRCEPEPWYEPGWLSSLHDLLNRAAAEASSGRLDRAIASATVATRLYRGDASGFSMLASLLIRAERYRDAVLAASKALDINPTHSKALNFRSFAYLKQRDFRLALDDLNRAIELEPDDQAAYANRSHCFEALGRHGEAAEDELALKRLQKSGLQNTTATGAFESRPSSRALSHEEVTYAVDVLRSAGLMTAAKEVLERFFDEGVPLDVVEQAMHAMMRLGLIDMLGAAATDDHVRHEVRTVAAGLVLRHEQEEGAEPPLPRHAASISYLETCISDSATPVSARQIAASGLAAHLVPENLVDLLKAIRDLDITSRTAAPHGLAVAVVLVKALGDQWRRFDLLKAMARDATLHPTLRELCGEGYGIYSQGGAATLLRSLRDERDTPASVRIRIDRYLAQVSTNSPGAQDAEGKEEMVQAGARVVGRNASCPCGSGKRFKQCHGILK